MTPSPRLLLISGPAGAGKSAVAELSANTHSSTCVRLTPDDIWDLIKSGKADTVNGWTDEAQRQHGITLDATAALASIYLKNGISVVVDDVVFPAWPPANLDAWRRRLPNQRIELVVLMPSWEVIVERNARRSVRDNLPEPMLREIFDKMAGWAEQDELPVIDNGLLSVEQTLSAIGTAIESAVNLDA